MHSMTERDRLERLVKERTDELEKSLKANESLFKVLIHDISSPLMVIKSYTHFLKENREDKDLLIDRMMKAEIAMEAIIIQTKKAYLDNKKNKVSLVPVKIEDCFTELSILYEDSLNDKKVSLKFNNHLPSDTLALAEQSSLTHSVLSNLLSNCIKFNSPDSKIEISAHENEKNIILEIKDQGPGIPDTIISEVLKNRESISTDGTNGEKGSGLGLSIVKSFVDSYGGKLEFDSYIDQDIASGTIIRITLDKATESTSSL
jgi:signal transduction histidine kinase